MCYNCRKFKKRREHFYSSKFVFGGPLGDKWSEYKFRTPVKMCQHESCFKKIDGRKERFQGQAQLNKNSNCQYYRRRLWRIWE